MSDIIIRCTSETKPNKGANMNVINIPFTLFIVKQCFPSVKLTLNVVYYFHFYLVCMSELKHYEK